MKTKYAYLFLFVFVAMTLGSCTSGKKSYQQGNYYGAVMKAVSRLRKNPNQKKAQETLREGYPLSVEWLLDQSQNALASGSPDKWKTVVANYDQINAMYDAIKRSPGALNIIPNPKSYYNELVESKNNAADESYQQALMAMSDNTREGAKAAYFSFLEADRYVPGYKDTRDRMAEAKYVATLKVLVNQIPIPSQRYQLSADFFQEKIQQFLNSYNTNEFVRYYSPIEAESENLQRPDQIMKIQFQDYSIGESHVKETVETLEKDSVVVGEYKIREDSVVNVYGTVKAKFTTFRKELITSGVLNARIIDAYNQEVLSTENFASEFIWVSEWAYFNGDERALSPKQLALTKQKEVPPPGPQDLFTEFTIPIYNQLTSQIKAFYSRY